MPNHHQHSLLALALFALLASGPGARAQSVDYVGRIGLYGTPEYTSSADGSQYSGTNYLIGGYLTGTSTRYNGATAIGTALWMADMTTATTWRIGLYSGAEFTNSSTLEQSSTISSIAPTGVVYGTSTRYNGATTAGRAAWIANPTAQTTTRVGLYTGPEFTSSSGDQASTPFYYSASVAVAGGSAIFNGAAESVGSAAWVADSSTGVTTRVGLYSDPEFLKSTTNAATSYVEGISSAGHVIGASQRFNGTIDTGKAAWVADRTGATTRVGLYSGAEFTSSADGSQTSTASAVNSSGQVIGYSTRYNGSASAGQAAWVADAATGTTTRIGLYSDPSFTSSNGTQISETTRLTSTGYVFGTSVRYVESGAGGQGVWVANTVTGITTRIGFYDSSEYANPSSDYQRSSIAAIADNGYAAGDSNIFNSLGNVGMASWVANAATGVTTRIGLYTDPGFANPSSGLPFSWVAAITESGYVTGHSLHINGQGAWIASAVTGATNRVGLYSGAEFVSTASAQSSTVSKITESGYAIGTSARYSGSAEAGQAVWVASASTGVSTRIGFYQEPQFTNAHTGWQESYITKITESGYVAGYSLLYTGTSTGTGLWVASASTGATTRVGLTDAVHTRSSDGYQTGAITDLTESGYACGYSARFVGTTMKGATAWVFDLSNASQIAFELSVNSVTGEANSSIYKLSEEGIAFGSYTLYDGGENLGLRAFVWSKDLGTILLNEALSLAIAANGWEHFSNVTFSLGDYLAGPGLPTGATSTSTGLYVVAIPEPNIGFLIISALGITVLISVRRRCARAGSILTLRKS